MQCIAVLNWHCNALQCSFELAVHRRGNRAITGSSGIVGLTERLVGVVKIFDRNGKENRLASLEATLVLP